MPTAIIVGHTGQDGQFLWEQLSASNYSLVGISSTKVASHRLAWDEPVEIRDAGSVSRLIAEIRPEQVYFLAAHHHSAQEGASSGEEALLQGTLVNANSFLNFMAACVTHMPTCRLFYASSSRIYGDLASGVQNELSPRAPTCPYGLSKLMGMQFADYYRRRKQLFVSCGILFNHESRRRGRLYVSQRIVNELLEIKLGERQYLELGNLSAAVDWGFAADYTRAMRSILEADAPDDYVIATGQTRTILDMVRSAAELMGIDPSKCVRETPSLLKRNSQLIVGDIAKIRARTGWTPVTSFDEMMEDIVRGAFLSRGVIYQG